MGFRDCVRKTLKWQNLILATMVPLLASPLLFVVGGPVAKCGFCLIVMAVYWVAEVIPLPVTSLLPVFLFPVFGIMKASEVSMFYFKETLMLFLGSLIVAVAVEKWNLHKRLALRTLTLVGPQPRWLLLGVMLPTWFLSMWMSNTATAAMMMPIVMAILVQIKECQEAGEDEKIKLMEKEKLATKVSVPSDEMISNGTEPEQEEEGSEPLPSRADMDSQFLFFAKSFSLVTAYSANIGGVATLTGTPPNILFKGLADGIFGEASVDNPVNFANWLGLGLPLSVILITVLWLWMQLYMEGIKCLVFWRKDRTNYDRVRETLRREYEKLGKMSYAETCVAICFTIMACLWITRKPGFVPGWGDLFKPKFVGDSTPAILMSVMLFILPAKPPSWLSCCKSKETVKPDDEEKKDSGPSSSYEALLDWKSVNQRLAWGVLLLMGGGFALAEGCERSGLSAWVSSHLSGLSPLPIWAIALLLSIIVAMATEVASNAATTTLFIPIVGATAIGMRVNPLVFMLPCTIASSLAFLLPVATPPNAIVFSAGYLTIKDMIICGIPMNILSVLALNIMMNTWAIPLYNLDFFDERFANVSGLFNTSSSTPLSWLPIPGNSTLLTNSTL